MLFDSTLDVGKVLGFGFTKGVGLWFYQSYSAIQQDSVPTVYTDFWNPKLLQWLGNFFLP